MSASCHMATILHPAEACVGLEPITMPVPAPRCAAAQQATLRSSPPSSARAAAVARQRGPVAELPTTKVASPGGRCHAASEAAAAADVEAQEAPPSTGRFDVSSSCVTPVFRSSPQTSGGGAGGAEATSSVQVLFLSEGNVCRSVFAEAILGPLLEGSGLSGLVTCSSKATRDYNTGEAPDARAQQVAAQHGLRLPEGHVARVFEPAVDIVAFDLVLVMDKFVAADCLKEVSVFDTIDPTAFYSSKVRSLGEFATGRKVGDIDDPLYGNMGDPSELDLLSSAIDNIRESCEGVVVYLQSLQTSLGDGESLKQRVARSLREMTALDWLVPPMLQKR